MGNLYVVGVVEGEEGAQVWRPDLGQVFADPASAGRVSGQLNADAGDPEALVVTEVRKFVPVTPNQQPPFGPAIQADQPTEVPDASGAEDPAAEDPPSDEDPAAPE